MRWRVCLKHTWPLRVVTVERRPRQQTWPSFWKNYDSMPNVTGTRPVSYSMARRLLRYAQLHSSVVSPTWFRTQPAMRLRSRLPDTAIIAILRSPLMTTGRGFRPAFVRKCSSLSCGSMTRGTRTKAVPGSDSRSRAILHAHTEAIFHSGIVRSADFARLLECLCNNQIARPRKSRDRPVRPPRFLRRAHGAGGAGRAEPTESHKGRRRSQPSVLRC